MKVGRATRRERLKSFGEREIPVFYLASFFLSSAYLQVEHAYCRCLHICRSKQEIIGDFAAHGSHALLPLWDGAGSN